MSCVVVGVCCVVDFAIDVGVSTIAGIVCCGYVVVVCIVVTIGSVVCLHLA